jgi:hypothetical protein
VYERPLRYVVPGEMVTLKVRPRFLRRSTAALSVSVERRRGARARRTEAA